MPKRSEETETTNDPQSGEAASAPPAEAPEAPAESAAQAQDEAPQQASRVETYSVGDKWGWRRVGQFGAVLHDSGTDWTTEKQAITDARRNDENTGVAIQGDGPDAPSRNAWT